jgi:hypothetical protein
VGLIQVHALAPTRERRVSHHEEDVETGQDRTGEFSALFRVSGWQEEVQEVHRARGRELEGEGEVCVASHGRRGEETWDRVA